MGIFQKLYEKPLPKKEFERKAIFSGQNQIKIKFESDSKIVDHLKNSLSPDRQYLKDQVSNEKYFLAKITKKNIDLLNKLKFEIDSRIEQYYNANLPKFPIHLDKILRQYQKEGFYFLSDLEGKAILADDMGIGKTLQSLLYLALNPSLRPALIIPPASLRLNWQTEIQKWIKEDCTIIRNKGHINKNINIGIISYNYINKAKYEIAGEKVKSKKEASLKLKKANEIAMKEGKKHVMKFDFEIMNELSQIDWKIFILDEAHKINNPKSNVYKVIQRLSTKVNKIIHLTGTPIDKTKHYFNMLNLVAPEIFFNRWSFQQRYCDPKHNGFGWQFNGSSNIEELKEKIYPYVLRRTKKEVLPELPEKTRIIVPIEIKNTQKYNDLLKDLFNKTQSTISEKTKNQVEAIKQQIAKDKLPDVIEWIKDYLEVKDKLVIGCVHREIVLKLHEVFKKNSVIMYGGMGDTEKQKSKDEFQNNPNIKLIIGNLNTIGLGHTLTAASDTATIEFDWSPNIHDQFCDRVLRLGQTSKESNHYFFVCKNTFEEDIISLLDEKRINISQIVDGKEVKEFDLLTKLMEKYK